jgi:hypothetical protein
MDTLSKEDQSLSHPYFPALIKHKRKEKKDDDLVGAMDKWNSWIHTELFHLTETYIQRWPRIRISIFNIY